MKDEIKKCESIKKVQLQEFASDQVHPFEIVDFINDHNLQDDVIAIVLFNGFWRIFYRSEERY